MKLLESRLVRHQRKFDRYEAGVKRFAWFPVILSNKSVIWLEHYFVTLKRFQSISSHGDKINTISERTITAPLFLSKVKNLEKYEKTAEDDL